MKRLPQEHCVIISREVGVESWDLDKMMSIVGKEVEARERHVQALEPTVAVLLVTNPPLRCY